MSDDERSDAIDSYQTGSSRDLSSSLVRFIARPPAVSFHELNGSHKPVGSRRVLLIVLEIVISEYRMSLYSGVKSKYTGYPTPRKIEEGQVPASDGEPQ